MKPETVAKVLAKFVSQASETDIIVNYKLNRFMNFILKKRGLKFILKVMEGISNETKIKY
jgi:hypothetical protein